MKIKSKEDSAYSKAEDYLNTFINYENKAFVRKKELKPARTGKLLKNLNIPYQNLKAIHIAGTKGKGSVATFAAYMLASSGFRVGFYTSPHFEDFRERIKIIYGSGYMIRDSLISRRDVVRIVEQFKPCLKRLKTAKIAEKISFFEIYTAIAFKHFLDKKVDFAVIETGLGGRFDATNVINPAISIITHIGYDHVNILGTRIADIAFEKAGIIKPLVPAVISPQKKAALRVIEKKCSAMGSCGYFLGKHFGFDNVRFKKNSTMFNFWFGNVALNNLRIFLKGSHQVENACLAVASLCVLKDKGVIDKEINFKKGLKYSCIKGRFEIVKKNPLIIMDIAHNFSSFTALRKSLKLYFPDKKIIFIFSVCYDKEVKKMIKCIPYDKIIITSFNNPRCLPFEEIKRTCRLKNAPVAKDIKEALKMAYAYYNRECLILISGSFFLVAEANKIIENGIKPAKI